MQPEGVSARTTGRAGGASNPAATGAREALLRASAEAIGLRLGDRQIEQLLAYVGLLHKWNAVYNLTAIRDPDDMLIQHLVDSLAIIPPLAAHAGVPLDRAQIADVGSGAGLPGIPLAIVYPDARIRLIEPIGKKTAFQRQCQAELALTNIIIYGGRAEAVDVEQDIVVSRAFASLSAFVAASAGMTGPATLLVAMKGQAPDDEIAALPPGLAVTLLPIAVPNLPASRHLVLLRRARG